jgi:predicted RNA-binding protein associated with RNAse of E/G family
LAGRHGGGRLCDMTARFEAGRLVVHRGFVDDRLVFVRTGRVVEHDSRGLRLWIPHGTPLAVSVAEDGRGLRDMPFHEWIVQREVLRPRTWFGPNIFMFIPPESHHSVWWFWDAQGRFVGWYVNLEEPSALWDDEQLAGVDTTDHDLDIWVRPDRRWAWKDEDEFLERQAYVEHYWVREPHRVRAEGQRVIRLIEAGEFPFDGTWRDFRPAPWSYPTDLPEGWDRPRVGLTAPAQSDG